MLRQGASLSLDDKTKEALQVFKGIVSGKSMSIENPVFAQLLIFLKQPGLVHLPQNEKNELVNGIKTCFHLDDFQLSQHLAGVTATELLIEPLDMDRSRAEALRLEQEFASLLPKGGYLAQYADYTSNSEGPLPYHIFSALVAVGVVLKRNIWFNMGYYKLYPPLAVFLLGPSGLRKTSSANIMVRMIQDLEITKIYPEKLTPEVLVASMQEMAQGLIYAPEMTTTLGKKKYLDGLVPLLTRIQDCPDILIDETIGRGQTILKDVAASILMCSTPDWFVSNTPEDTFGGGFIARHIMVMQNDSPREEHIPSIRNPHLRDGLVHRLRELGTLVKGEVQMDSQCYNYHKEWYHEFRSKTKHPEHPLLGTYYQRKPDHMKKVAMCIHAAENFDLTLNLKSMEVAINLLDWAEKFIPPMLATMFKTTMGESHDFVLQAIRHNGGFIKHSELVRKVQHKMAAPQLRAIIGSLLEAEQIKETKSSLQHLYTLR